MKKVLSITALAIVFAACGNNSNTTEEVKDSVMQTIDSTADARKDSIEETTDSVKQRLDKTFDKTDSANNAKADTASTQRK